MLTFYAPWTTKGGGQIYMNIRSSVLRNENIHAITALLQCDSLPWLLHRDTLCVQFVASEGTTIESCLQEFDVKRSLLTAFAQLGGQGRLDGWVYKTDVEPASSVKVHFVVQQPFTLGGKASASWKLRAYKHSGSEGTLLTFPKHPFQGRNSPLVHSTTFLAFFEMPLAHLPEVDDLRRMQLERPIARATDACGKRQRAATPSTANDQPPPKCREMQIVTCAPSITDAANDAALRWQPFGMGTSCAAPTACGQLLCEGFQQDFKVAPACHAGVWLEADHMLVKEEPITACAGGFCARQLPCMKVDACVDNEFKNTSTCGPYQPQQLPPQATSLGLKCDAFCMTELTPCESPSLTYNDMLAPATSPSWLGDTINGVRVSGSDPLALTYMAASNPWPFLAGVTSVTPGKDSDGERVDCGFQPVTTVNNSPFASGCIRSAPPPLSSDDGFMSSDELYDWMSTALGASVYDDMLRKLPSSAEIACMAGGLV